MRSHALYLLACLGAGLAPLFGPGPEPSSPNASFPGWPEAVAGLPLEPSPPLPVDRDLSLFPGRFGRFQSGPRHVLLRWLDRPARELHSLRECYRGLGYAIVPEPTEAAFDGGSWSVFRAEREGEALRVYERVEDGEGRLHPELSRWYWSALFGRSRPPYRSVAIVERATQGG